MSTFFTAITAAGRGMIATRPNGLLIERPDALKFVGFVRYIYSLKQWPEPEYRRPPQEFLDALETQQWCMTWKTELPYEGPWARKSPLGKRRAGR